jgi:glycosyltransferase involved in cell wall biosynthesis
MTVLMGEPLDAAQEPASPRGRIVMLVDNGVEGDSRVQKAARSAAAAGWDVILLGVREPTSRRAEWRIGDAQVRLVRCKRPLALHRSALRASLRRPLAYGNVGMANNRLQTIRAWHAELRQRYAALAIARRTGGSRWHEVVGKARLLPARVLVRALAAWVRFRAAEYNRLTAARENPESLLNRAGIRFWQALRGDRCWRNLDPSLWDFEIGFGRVVDRLKPDIIHANDYRMIGVGARAKIRAAARGRDVKLVWDAHEYVPGLTPSFSWPRWLPAQIAHEREYARHADAVVTISPALAELLRDGHRLPELPAVVMNCPERAEIGAEGALDLDVRTACVLGPDTPLLAYCGGINAVRGVTLMVEALPDLPGVHAAFVSVPPNGRRNGVDELEERARALGVADRVHILPYVKHWQVVPFLSTADAAVSPLLHLPNHEIALSNKFFEYSHARLPLIVSDVRTMAAMVRQTGQGEVFRAGDRDEYVRAVRAVLADPQRYRAAYDTPGLLDQWTWSGQAAVLDGVYRSLVPVAPSPVPVPG